MGITAQAAMTPREAALELLTHHHEGLHWKASQFLGNVAGCPERPLPDRQLNWLGKLAEPAGLIVEGASA